LARKTTTTKASTGMKIETNLGTSPGTNQETSPETRPGINQEINHRMTHVAEMKAQVQSDEAAKITETADKQKST
jgi:hypothetical protein